MTARPAHVRQLETTAIGSARIGVPRLPWRCRGPTPHRVVQDSTDERSPLMSETAEFTIGSEVACSDGICGELTRVVVDPVARALTHLVVEPRNRQGTGRLVPIELVDAAAEGIRLRCTQSEFDAM